MKFLVALFAAVGIALAAVGFVFYTQLQPANPSQITRVDFTVPKGQSVPAIGKRLQEAGLIKNAFLFRFVVGQKNLHLQAGTFQVSPSMSLDEIAQALTTGTSDIRFTIPEGWRVEEVADSLATQDLPNFQKKEFLTLAKNNEGFLFPDTYIVPQSSTAQDIFTLMRDTFDKKVTNGLKADIDASGKTLPDIINLASIVQREARQPGTMKIVAGILQNRLDLGMALNVDATLQYIHGYDRVEKTWWSEPNDTEKESTSAYNTYKHAGLPPQAIDSPGINAITAVLHPTPSDYLFYVTDRQGVMHYAKTLEEHNRFVQQYLR